MGLTHPICARLEERYGDARCKVAVASMCGYRTSMEDSHSIVLSMPSHPNATFVGLYDGHGGQDAARFCAQYLAQHIDSLRDWSDESIQDAVMRFDAKFCSPENPNRRHGSTCVFVIIEHLPGNEVNLIVSNSGDSRAIWSYQTPSYATSFDALTDDHKPTNETERTRILKAGGTVVQCRVDGDLALSRAIGDWPYKSNEVLPPIEQKVIAFPDIERRTVSTTNGYLLVACDGLFERLRNAEVHAIVHQGLQQSKDPMYTVQLLLQSSLEAGSKDNMSAALVLFEPGHHYHEPKPHIYYGPIQPSDKSFMSCFFKFCDEVGFGPESRQYVEQWHAENGTRPSIDMSSSESELESPNGNLVEQTLLNQLITRSVASHSPEQDLPVDPGHQIIIEDPTSGERTIVLFTDGDCESSGDDGDEVEHDQMTTFEPEADCK